MPLYDYTCDAGHRFERLVPLARLDGAQTCACGRPARREISCPHVVSDAMPARYGADGRLHDSRQSYKRSLAPGGNPRGERFYDLAPGESLPPFKAPEFDRKQRRDDIVKTMKDLEYGRIKPATPVSGAIQPGAFQP